MLLCFLSTLFEKKLPYRLLVSIESVIYSDSWRGYKAKVDVGYDKYFRVNISKMSLLMVKTI